MLGCYWIVIVVHVQQRARQLRRAEGVRGLAGAQTCERALGLQAGFLANAL
jgi:hypothetical protein